MNKQNKFNFADETTDMPVTEMTINRPNQYPQPKPSMQPKTQKPAQKTANRPTNSNSNFNFAKPGKRRMSEPNEFDYEIYSVVNPISAIMQGQGGFLKEMNRITDFCPPQNFSNKIQSCS